MNSRFIIIAILIFIKVIGVASHAKAGFSYDEIKVMDWYKDHQEQREKERRPINRTFSLRNEFD